MLGVGVSLTGLAVRGGDPFAVFAANGFKPSLIASFKNGVYAKPVPVLGPEAATNGTFDTDTGWNKGAGWTIADGKASHTDVSGALTQPFAADANKTWVITWTLSDYVSGAAYIGFLGGTNAFAASRTANGTYTEVITTSTSVTTLYIGTSNIVASIDDISVREITSFAPARTTFADLLNFDRTGSGTYVTSDGAIETAADGVARLGHHKYDGSQWVNKGFLFEPDEATNFHLYSNDQSQANWVASNEVTKNVSQTASPTDVVNAGLIVPNTANAVHAFRLGSFSVTSGNKYTFSISVKPSGYTRFRMEGTSQFSGAAAFVVTDGEIQKNGFYRHKVGLTATSTSAFAQVQVTFLTDAGVITHAGDGASGLYFWGAQFEDGEVASSSIPTAGASVTRQAETADISAADAPFLASGMSGAHKRLLNYADTGSATEQTLFDRRVDANNRITVTLDTAGANTGKVTLTVVNGGTSVSVTSTNQISPGSDTVANVAWRVSSSEINIALNGTSATAVSNTAGVPSVGGADCVFGGAATFESDLLWAADIADTGIEGASA